MDDVNGWRPARTAELGSSVATEGDPLLSIERSTDWNPYAALADDVRRGLSASPKYLPPKYFYDEHGSRLFEAICRLPEYYLTRAESALLARVSGDLISRSAPTCLVELGSGASQKTRLLLDVLVGQVRQPSYVPFDVSEEVLCASAVGLRRAYPTLRVHAIVGDYEQDLGRLPRNGRRLIAFLGSTIGNLSPAETTAFLQTIGRQLDDGDTLLLGLDLVKSPEVLHAAYNDRDGVTAAFNRNILRVLNRELGADFNPWRFAHLAFYDPRAAQIEMHLRADERQTVHIRRLGMEITLAGGETIRTEISRKFTVADATMMMAEAGCALQQWYESPDHYFALALGMR